VTPRAPEPGRLDHALYEPRASWLTPGRPWPGGRVAACVLIHLEAFENDAPASAYRDPGLRGDFGTFVPDYRSHSLFEYGSRIGVHRLLDLLQPLGWSVAVAVNGCIARARPSLLRQLQSRGVQLLASGWSASRMVTSQLAEEEERQMLAQSADALAQAVGARATGYASQDYGYSLHSARLLEALGFDHVVDWPNDEQPYTFGPGRQLVVLPPAADLDDAQAILVRKLLARRWAAAVAEALGHWRSSAATGTVFILPLHAWVAGAAHRSAALRRALETCEAQAFWQACPSVISRCWREGAGLPTPDTSL